MHGITHLGPQFGGGELKVPTKTEPLGQMLWPSATPQGIVLPDIGGQAPDGGRALRVAVSRAGYLAAVVTARTLYLYRIRPFAPVAAFRRSDASVEAHGDNEDVFFRPDGNAVGVTTVGGAVLSFQITTSNSPAEVLKWERKGVSDSDGGEGHGRAHVLGPGEALGVHEVTLRFRMILKVNSGVSDVAVLEGNKVVIATKAPAALQVVRLAKDVTPATALVAELSWAPDESLIRHIEVSRAMSLAAVAFDSGRVYLCAVPETTAENKLTFAHAHKFHDPANVGIRDGDNNNNSNGEAACLSAINARFSVVAVGCERGAVHLYNVRDLSGNIVRIRRIAPPSAAVGSVTALAWADDGSALFVGYDGGWALHSVYGMLLASSSQASPSDVQRESWLGGVRAAGWVFAGDSVLVVPSEAVSSGPHFWQLGVARWSGAAAFTRENLGHPILFDDNRILLYRGAEQSDLTTIDRDALLWLSAAVPSSYIAENWPIQCVSASPDGRYVAVAGIRGFTHYSLNSGRWKLFSEDYMDREFTVRGGMLWYDKYIIASVDTEHYQHEVRVYSREADLDVDNVVASVDFAAPILRSCIVSDMLLLYTLDNHLHFYRLDLDDGSLALDALASVPLDGLVHSPARVRILGGLNRNEIGHRRSSVTAATRNARRQQPPPGARTPAEPQDATVYLLIDGILTRLEPTQTDDGITYAKRVLHHNVEYYHITHMRDGSSILWAFDGQDMLAWPQFDAATSFEGIPYHIRVDSYPISVLVDKGIFAGYESEPVPSREKAFTYFKHWTTTQLFLPYLLEHYLRSGFKNRALALAREYDSLKYFTHVLEMLLFRVLESENVDEDPKPSSSSTLSSSTSAASPVLRDTAELVSQFPQRLDVILGSTRKTEVKYWPRLFEVIGSPHELFEHCVASGNLRTAAGFLLVLHNLESYDASDDNSVRLFKHAYESGDFELCCDLSRFLTAVDPSTKTLRHTLASVGVSLLDIDSTSTATNASDNATNGPSA